MNEPYQHQPMEHSTVEMRPATHEMMSIPACITSKYKL